MHSCRDPLLVDASSETWLPDAPFDYNWGATHPEIGCNRLRCEACGAMVRNLPRAAIAGPGVDLSALHAIEDLRGHAAIATIPDDRGRLYLCRCQAYRAVVATPPDSPEERGPHLPWSCAGHPPLELPCALDGIEVRAGDLAATTRAALPEHWPAPLPRIDKDLRGFWLARLYHVLEEDSDRAALGAAVAAQLEAPESAVRAGAIFFFLWVPGAEAAEALVRAARVHRELFRGHADPKKPSYSLEARLLQAIEFVVRSASPQSSPGSAAGLELLKEELLAGRNPADILYQVDRRDHGWLVAHGAQIGRSAPALTPDLIYLLRGEPEAALIPIVHAFAAAPGADLGRLETELRRRLPDEVLPQALAQLEAAKRP